MLQLVKNGLINWLTHESEPTTYPVCNFERTCYELRPCDVILIEGRSKVSEIVKTITQSNWSHSVLYIGKLHDITNKEERLLIQKHFKGSHDTHLLVEGVLGKGTIVTPLTNYRKDNLRICRPQGISQHDANNVIKFVINKLGTDYDVKQIIDLARLLLPWSIFPKSWRNSLFSHRAGDSTRTICSGMIAEAFAKVKYPILPEVTKHSIKGIELQQRSPRLFTPKDFDYSPYFEIIKHPFIEFADQELYRNLPWSQ